MMPPSADTTTASVRNCWRILRWRAPVAMRMPISWIRSVTLTSMMFITPMPPTNSEIAAIEPSSMVRVFWVSEIMSSKDAILNTRTSLVPWRCTSRSIAACSVASMASMFSTARVIERR